MMCVVNWPIDNLFTMGQFPMSTLGMGGESSQFTFCWKSRVRPFKGSIHPPKKTFFGGFQQLVYFLYVHRGGNPLMICSWWGNFQPLGMREIHVVQQISCATIRGFYSPPKKTFFWWFPATSILFVCAWSRKTLDG